MSKREYETMTRQTAELALFYNSLDDFEASHPSRAQIDIREYDITHAGNPRRGLRLVGSKTIAVPLDHPVVGDSRWETQYAEPFDDGYIEVLELNNADIDGWLKPALTGVQ